MYNSIQHFIEFGVKKIEERVKELAQKPTDQQRAAIA